MNQLQPVRNFECTCHWLVDRGFGLVLTIVVRWKDWCWSDCAQKRQKNQTELDFETLVQIVWLRKHTIGHSPMNIAVKRDGKKDVNSAVLLQWLEVFDALAWALDLVLINIQQNSYKRQAHTLTAIVLTAATISRESPRIWLFRSDGLYSHIMIIISTAAIFVRMDMTLVITRLMTWVRQGIQCAAGSNEYIWQSVRVCLMWSHATLLLLALLTVIQKSYT